MTDYNSALTLVKRIKKQKKIETRYCKYCDGAEALVIGKTDDIGIEISPNNYLIAYGYDVHGPGSNGIQVKINYCPMCGKEFNRVVATHD